LSDAERLLAEKRHVDGGYPSDTARKLVITTLIQT
jgi:hypothetical protein